GASRPSRRRHRASDRGRAVADTPVRDRRRQLPVRRRRGSGRRRDPVRQNAAAASRHVFARARGDAVHAGDAALPMSAIGLRLLAHVHGHLAWLSTLALYHPAWMLYRGRRRLPIVAVAATGLVTLTSTLGAWLYPAYRTLVKPAVFRTSL